MASAERVDARVLQKSPDQRLHPNVLGEAGHAGPQTAYAADHDIDLHACAASGIKGVDDLWVDERIAFYPDLGRLAEPGIVNLVGDVAQQRLLERDRRNRHLLKTVGLGIAGDEIENTGHVPPDRRIGCEKRNVGINAGGDGVIVAGAKVTVVDQAPPSRRTTIESLAWVLSSMKP